MPTSIIMKAMMYVSLGANVVVLAPLCVLLAIRAPSVDAAWGGYTAARGILLSVYLSILVISILLLFRPVPAMVAALLALQVLYKTTTPFTVDIKNPVVISNLAISCLHVATIATIGATIGATMQNHIFKLNYDTNATNTTNTNV